MAFHIKSNIRIDGSIWPLISYSIETDHDHWCTADSVTITAVVPQILQLVSRTTLVNEGLISLTGSYPWFPDHPASDHKHPYRPPLQ